ncbi:peptidyl-tRNA hydrolase [Glonium stellatum]|uniref:peptidyl-tRNA hydrolase n=1 Tax=Glonium stellatum TaxID=574774 RepID=A0A8E2JPW6_9PEZI|nr:peptidyl-tRNA hydrolase [Glonium stellatum]
MSRANLPLLVASIGNPAPAYTNTLHSAGHAILNRIQVVRPFTPFEKNKKLAGGLVSVPITKSRVSLLPFFGEGGRRYELQPEDDHWTLWQSPSLMNVSGKPLGTAWKAWEKDRGMGGVLVVIHDELEKELGKVSLRRGGSARGHNGLKSIQAALPNTPWVRIGIGIGRPASREPADVARYVLKKMSQNELATIEDSVGEVIELLRDIAEGKR